MTPQKRDYQREYRRRNVERVRQASSDWKRRNRDKVSATNRRLSLKRNYGLSLEQYDALYAAQSGVCAICYQSEAITFHGKIARLSVDHHHETGLVRGLLCHDCNTGIGKLGDSSERLRAAALYLDKHK